MTNTTFPFATSPMAGRNPAPRRRPILEEFNYTKIRFNVGLTDNDFEPRQPELQIPRSRQPGRAGR